MSPSLLTLPLAAPKSITKKILFGMCSEHVNNNMVDFVHDKALVNKIGLKYFRRFVKGFVVPGHTNQHRPQPVDLANWSFKVSFSHFRLIPDQIPDPLI